MSNLIRALYRVDNGKRFARKSYAPGHDWTWIKEMIAEEFNCDPDDVTEVQEAVDVLYYAHGGPVAYAALEGSAFRTKATALVIVDAVLDLQHEADRETIAKLLEPTIDCIKREAAEAAGQDAAEAEDGWPRRRSVAR